MTNSNDCYIGQIYFNIIANGVSFRHVFPCCIRKEDFVENDDSVRFSDDFIELFRKSWYIVAAWDSPIILNLMSADPCNLKSEYTSDDQGARATTVAFGILGYLDEHEVPGASLRDIWHRIKENTER